MKETIFILAPYPLGQAPSQRFRFEQYMASLEKMEYIISFHPFINEKTWNLLYLKGHYIQKIAGLMGSFWRRWKLLVQLRKADHIFIHREAAQIGPPIFEWIIAKVLRKKYVYDFDDAIWLPNYSQTNARFHRLKAYWKAKYIMKWAHKISAGNAYLKSYAEEFNSNVQIIPTTIDTVNYHNQITDYSSEQLIIGWTGTHTTLHYLTELVPILQRLEKNHSFIFHVISNEPPSFDLNSLQFIRWSKATEIDDLARFSIGVMPLKEDIWSNGKCGFKGLQYMSLGIPTIMSPVGVNTEIIDHQKNGLLAATSEEWEESLTQLLQDPKLRKRLGLAGQETIQRKYSVVANTPNYLDLFTS